MSNHKKAPMHDPHAVSNRGLPGNGQYDFAMSSACRHRTRRSRPPDAEPLSDLRSGTGQTAYIEWLSGKTAKPLGTGRCGRP